MLIRPPCPRPRRPRRPARRSTAIRCGAGASRLGVCRSGSLILAGPTCRPHAPSASWRLAPTGTVVHDEQSDHVSANEELVLTRLRVEARRSPETTLRHVLAEHGDHAAARELALGVGLTGGKGALTGFAARNRRATRAFGPKEHDAMYCHVNVKTGSRGTGQSAAAKYDYISRDGKYEAACQDEVVHLESGSMPSFASSDARLYWAAADVHERSNGRLFRSLTAALPNSLDPADRLELARSFAAHVTGGELPYTLAVHAGESKKSGVADNPHLHLVFSERVNDGVERAAEQWFRRAAPKKGDPASGGARKTERTKPRSWLEETRSAWAGEMNLAFERAGVDDRVTSESHATQLAQAHEAGDAVEEERLLLNPPSVHIGPAAKHRWEDRSSGAPELKPDRYAAYEEASATAREARSAYARAAAEAAEARLQVEALDAEIAALEAEAAADERRAGLAAREASVRATSAGGQWLEEAHQSVLARADGRLTPGERERAVETVEGRLRADLDAREESLMATSTGSTLLREEYGEGGAADAPRQSFAERESVLERIAQRVDEDLAAREEALRSVPLGRRHLSAAEQARAGGGAAAPPTAAERESVVRAAEQRVGEELDRRQERVLAATGDDRLLAEAAEELAARGAVFGDGGFEERALIIDRAEDLLEVEHAGLELEEGDLLKAAGGEELLRNARRDVLGDDDREAETLVDGWAVIEQAAAAKARVEALGIGGIGGMDLYHAHLADIDPRWGVDGNAATTRGNQDAALSAAESDVARLGRLRAVLSDEAAAARYREVLGGGPDRFDTAALDRALAVGEREREERAAAAGRAAALKAATEKARAAAARSKVVLPHAGVRAVYETGETHAAGLAAVERTTEALDDAADQRLPAGTIIDAWNRSAPGRRAAVLAVATAAARLEEERAEARRQQAAIERNSRVKRQLGDPASADAFIEALDAEDPSWRSGTSPARIDRALDVAERDSGRREVATRRHQEHEVVLETERRFPGATSTAWQGAGGRFDGTTEVGRAGRRVSRELSDRALVRAFAAEKAEPPAPRNLVQRLYDWLRTRLERLFGRSPGPSAEAATLGPAASAERPAEAGRPRPAAFEERYCREWPEHAADIRRPDFERLAAGASSRNRLFEREEPRSSRWTAVEPGELPAALAKPSPAWSDKAVGEVTRRATAFAPDRTVGRRVAEAHLSGYESRLPAEYSHSAEWRAVLKRAEEAVWKVQAGWRYKRADRRKDDRKKRELEAAAINRACGGDARRLHGKMMAAREAARPVWEVTVRIRAVRELIRREAATRLKQGQARERARERERAADRPPPERKRTRDRGRGLDR